MSDIVTIKNLPQDFSPHGVINLLVGKYIKKNCAFDPARFNQSRLLRIKKEAKDMVDHVNKNLDWDIFLAKEQYAYVEEYGDVYLTVDFLGNVQFKKEIG